MEQFLVKQVKAMNLINGNILWDGSLFKIIKTISRNKEFTDEGLIIVFIDDSELFTTDHYLHIIRIASPEILIPSERTNDKLEVPPGGFRGGEEIPPGGWMQILTEDAIEKYWKMHALPMKDYNGEGKYFDKSEFHKFINWALSRLKEMNKHVNFKTK